MYSTSDEKSPLVSPLRCAIEQAGSAKKSGSPPNKRRCIQANRCCGPSSANHQFRTARISKISPSPKLAASNLHHQFSVLIYTAHGAFPARHACSISSPRAAASFASKPPSHSNARNHAQRLVNLHKAHARQGQPWPREAINRRLTRHPSLNVQRPASGISASHLRCRRGVFAHAEACHDSRRVTTPGPPPSPMAGGGRLPTLLQGTFSRGCLYRPGPLDYSFMT
jgi:hypothetical protein